MGVISLFYTERMYKGNVEGTINQAPANATVEESAEISFNGPFVDADLPILTRSECKKVKEILMSHQEEAVENICDRLNGLLSEKYEVFFEALPDNLPKPPSKNLYEMIENQIENYEAYDEIKQLTNEIVSFIRERDWEQFHRPKDTALALSIEASELNEAFLWKSEEEVDLNKIKEELADVLIYSIDLARQYNIDIVDIIRSKISKNAEKYPVEKSKGTAKKYTEL